MFTMNVNLLTFLLIFIIISISESGKLECNRKKNLYPKFIFSIAKSWSNGMKSAFTASIILTSSINVEAMESSQQLMAYNNIQRVQESLKYVKEDINKGGDPKTILNEIKILLNNYKLRENVEISASLIPKDNRSNGIKLGKEAFEDLTQVLEYFPDDVDNVTGKRTPPLEVLMFAQQAADSASMKLKEMLLLFPDDIRLSLSPISSSSQ